jgi:hypothetical protein
LESAIAIFPATVATLKELALAGLPELKPLDPTKSKSPIKLQPTISPFTHPSLSVYSGDRQLNDNFFSTTIKGDLSRLAWNDSPEFKGTRTAGEITSAKRLMAAIPIR